MKFIGRWKTLPASAKLRMGVISGATVGLGLLSFTASIRSTQDAMLDPEPSDQGSMPSSTVKCVDGAHDLQLKSVQIFFRHGARTPVRHIPGVKEVNYDSKFILGNVPYAEIPYQVRELKNGGKVTDSGLDEFYRTIQFEGGVHGGMLTKIGKDQAYLLGRKIKKRYVEELNLVGKNLSTKEIFFQSTNVNRCISSLGSVIAGIYGASNISEPVTIPVQESQNEFLIPNARHCACLRQLQREEGHNLHISKYLDDIREKIFSHIGQRHKQNGQILDMMQWRDHIICRKTHGLPIPSWLEDMLLEIEEAAVYTMKSFVCGSNGTNAELLSLTAGPVLGMIKKNMELTQSNDSSAKKLYLFSCHDSSLIPLLETLQINDERWPPYSAYLCLELWEDKFGDNWVQLLYCDKEMTPAGLTSPKIPYKQFTNMIKPYAVNFDEYKNRCENLEHFHQQAKPQEKSDTVNKEGKDSSGKEQNAGL